MSALFNFVVLPVVFGSLFSSSTATNGVCYRTMYRRVSHNVTTVGYTMSSYTDSYRCNWVRRCRRTIYVMQSTTQYRIVTRAEAYTTSHCCAGFTGSPPNCYQISPEVIPLDNDQLVTANKSQSAVLSFQINSNAYPPVSTSNICWFYSPNQPPTLHAMGFQFQEITHLLNRTRESTLAFSNDSLGLTIQNVVPAEPDDPETDSGRYFLQATNEAGANSSYIDLIVFVQPIVRETSALTKVNLNNPAAIYCLATGYPIPMISWRKNSEDINIHSVADRIQVIEFTPKLLNTSGNVSSSECTCVRSSGTINRESILNLLGRHTDLTVEEIFGLGDIGVVGLLLFEEILEEDAANYTCMATNTLPGSVWVNISGAITVVILDSVLIQLRLKGVDSCPLWVTDDGRQKIDVVNQNLLSNVEERCQCGFSLTNIIAPKFRCFEGSENAVTYRVEISGTPIATVGQIVSHIEEWLVEGALIHFDVILIPVDSSCSVVVTLFDPECNIPTTSLIPEATSPLAIEQSVPLAATVGGGVGGFVVLLVIGVITVIVIARCIRAKRSGKFTVDSDQRSRNEVKLDVVAANKHDQAEEYYETIGKMDFPRDLENKVYDYAHPPAADYEQPVPMLPKRTPGNNKFQYNPCSAYKAPGSKQDPKSVKY